VHPGFPAEAFVEDALDGYEPLELVARGRKVADALHRHLPDDYPAAIAILCASLGLPLTEGAVGSDGFLYMPHVIFVAEHGRDHFEASMEAQYQLTRRFTAEFSIRVFLEKETERTLDRLRVWASDPSEDVRRLVSEGTRPRLPWAPRLRAFQVDPRPVLELLELLKDDPSEYVRRSVANNLNDIAKDHPAVVVETCRRWWGGATRERQRLVRHALRTLVKRGDPDALGILGFAGAGGLAIEAAAITPSEIAIGDEVTMAFDLVNRSATPRAARVDLRVHFVKAGGRTGPKVFVLREVQLPAQDRVRLTKRLLLAQRTTRTVYPGRHAVDVLVNGAPLPLGELTVVPAG
jgi:3-methyladenine DNA glycosylase AlkC